MHTEDETHLEVEVEVDQLRIFLIVHERVHERPRTLDLGRRVPVARVNTLLGSPGRDHARGLDHTRIRDLIHGLALVHVHTPARDRVWRGGVKWWM